VGHVLRHSSDAGIFVQIQALKNMGYNITRAKLSEDSKNKFYITNATTSEKVTRSTELEAIRQCILHTMMEFHPEAEPLIATGATSENPSKLPPLGAQFHVRINQPPA
jgi:hypothetical protein